MRSEKKQEVGHRAGSLDPRSVIDPHKKFWCYHVPLGVASDPNLSEGAKLAYGVLKFHWGSPDNGRKQRCQPKTDTLAREMGTSSRTAERWVSELRKNGYIKTVPKGPKPPEYYFLAHPRLGSCLRKKSESGPPLLTEQGTPDLTEEDQSGPPKSEDLVRQDLQSVPPKSGIAYKEEEKFKEKSSSSELKKVFEGFSNSGDDDLKPSGLSEEEAFRRTRALIAQGTAPDPDSTMEVIAKKLGGRSWSAFYEIAWKRTTAADKAGGGHYVTLVAKMKRLEESETLKRAVNWASGSRDMNNSNSPELPSLFRSCNKCIGGYITAADDGQKQIGYCTCKLGQDLQRVERRKPASELKRRKSEARTAETLAAYGVR